LKTLITQETFLLLFFRANLNCYQTPIIEHLNAHY